MKESPVSAFAFNVQATTYSVVALVVKSTGVRLAEDNDPVVVAATVAVVVVSRAEKDVLR